MLSCVIMNCVFHSFLLFVNTQSHSAVRRCRHQYIAIKMPPDFSFSGSSRKESISSSLMRTVSICSPSDSSPPPGYFYSY